MTTSKRQDPVDYIERTKQLYSSLGYPSYRWIHSESSPPWAPLNKPLSDCRVGLVSSGGVYVEGQVAFHHRDDTSLRIISSDVETSDLRATHFAYDLADARRDPNVVFPIDTLRALEKDGSIGELSPRAYTFMGGIYSSRKLEADVVPEMVRRLGEDQVDLALMVPV